MKLVKTLSLVLLMALGGCASTSEKTASANQWFYPPMAIPLQPSVQQEVQIARITQLLKRDDLSKDVRSKMLNERGNYYDSVGLRDLARLDYNQSLSLNPAQPDIFNVLGVFLTQVGEYDAAYDAFDSTLELDPSNSYASRNRAVALYYGDRLELAQEEMANHYQEDPSDPFRALWLYIIESEMDYDSARDALLSRYQEKDDQWGWVLVALTLGEINEEQALKAVVSNTRDNTLLAQRLTEVYFYLAKRYQQEGDYVNAISLYKLTLSLNVYEYVEHRYSFLELARVYDTVQAEQNQADIAANY
ncbi:lipoprotein NlpI [Vibrio maerlii]|uniref:lipoprotein NlpI n=1 Tax=Vibrio maerlii TaxID=2231648 RepID=UPI000E3D47E4|nr:lipoprotein NlpI [Vibrio maerlii]